MPITRRLIQNVATTARGVALLGLLIPAAALADPAPTEAAPAAEPPAVDPTNPDTCAPCHAAVVEEWRSSLHARSHHSRDPIYAGLRRVRMAKEGPQVANACAKCHTPLADGPEDPSLAALNGVSCATCHNVAHVASTGVGADRLTRFEDPLKFQGPNTPRAGLKAPHALGGAPPAHMTDGMTLCLACHETLSNGKVTLCNTGVEFGGVGGAFPEQRCIDCHMPIVEGPSGSMDRDQAHTSHRFIGAHRRWQAGDSGADALEPVALTGQLSGRTLTVTIANQSGHGWPTGFPGRMATLKLTGLDAAGQPVWTNFTEQAAQSDPQAVLMASFVDAQGAPTLPPYATRIARDSRLRPSETRALTWQVPASVQRVKGQLMLRLVPPPAHAVLGVTDSPLSGPRPVVGLDVTRAAP